MKRAPRCAHYFTMPTMKSCTGCGAVSADEVRFCSSCGRAVTTSDAGFDTPTVSLAPDAEYESPLSQQHPPQLGAFAPGTVLAQRYRVVALLGRGGMGEVYRAEDLKLRNTVALKFLAPELQDDPVALARLYDEVRNAREIAHPNVCRVYDIGEAVSETGGRHFLTMEYVDGEDLAALLRRIRRLPADKALETSHQICAGLSAVHDAGLLHRDLKPANVMLDGRGRVRITDFGLALRNEGETGRRTTAGTPPYMAPEQISRGETSMRSDIYSLGLVLYEVFTGHLPYDSPPTSAGTPGTPQGKRPSTHDSWLRIHTEAVPTLLSAHVRDIDPLVESTILSCLCKDPDARPATVHQVEEGLKAVQQAPRTYSVVSGSGGGTGSGNPVSSIPSEASTPKRSLRPVLVSALIMLVAATAIAYYFFNGSRHMPFEHFSLTRAIDNPHVRVTTISPDGRYIASVVRDQGVESLWVHNIPTNSERAILQDAAIRYNDLVFSPDSSYIYFSSPVAGKAPGQDDEMRIPVLGGTPSRVFQDIGAPISFIGRGQRVCIYREYETAGEWKYFNASADGGDEQLLYTGKAAFPQAPSCSPDGKLTVVEDESGKLETITFATGKIETLAPATLNHWFYALEWDPNGKGLFAITVEKFHYNGQLAYITYPAGKLHQITNDLNDYSGISVTADASTIVTTQKDRNTHFIDLPLADTGHPQEHHLGDLEWFTWIDPNRLLISGDDSVLKTADLSRDETETLNVAKDHFFFQPALCGPGAIVASGNTADQKNPGVYKMQMDGSVATRLTHGTQDLWPQCTPDGRQLFYSDDHDDQNQPKLMHVDIESGAAQPFTDGVYLQVSRDGKLIALHDVDKTSQLKLFATETLHLLKSMPMPPKSSYFIALAADNKSIFYFERNEAGATVWRMPIDKGQPVQLASFPGRIFKYMQASPDGTRIGLVAQEPQSQVILVHDTK